MSVVDIRLYENARQDTWRLFGIETDCDPQAGLGRDLDEIAIQLQLVQTAAKDDDAAQLALSCRRIGEDASVLGLNRIARVARAVEKLLHQNDPNALAANVARLMRLGDGLFEDVWGMQNQPG